MAAIITATTATSIVPSEIEFHNDNENDPTFQRHRESARRYDPIIESMIRFDMMYVESFHTITTNMNESTYEATIVPTTGHVGGNSGSDGASSSPSSTGHVNHHHLY